jgi:hypothetical protein
MLEKLAEFIWQHTHVREKLVERSGDPLSGGCTVAAQPDPN